VRCAAPREAERVQRAAPRAAGRVRRTARREAERVRRAAPRKAMGARSTAEVGRAGFWLGSVRRVRGSKSASCWSCGPLSPPRPDRITGGEAAVAPIDSSLEGARRSFTVLSNQTTLPNSTPRTVRASPPEAPHAAPAPPPSRHTPHPLRRPSRRNAISELAWRLLPSAPRPSRAPSPTTRRAS
jgi:hypothetical protein